ncbi:magnesium transporter CorA family protein [Aspergillus aculeatinus CBS 121060]|uniref:Mg2+ transporter protein n=2 Tax=Aspergillus subgen. Circumdati TaxID=2720871 RepID=A0ACD1H385_9EURO|nr:Mg2+ transporter protein [Aspergillus brunneoviolaceus CBS 621.78]XP_025501815.1 Mg2+ transporter protein [Aspergillus aculeatinus CBS 121060]RAH43532.1 Mg2+ transporter protein [Aspergillus brunneoviolaceus CBS 621.78]RAH67992.1 Mg2+ transporter protein [Aspergillus aculeatinus CBS 121060]
MAASTPDFRPADDSAAPAAKESSSLNFFTTKLDFFVHAPSLDDLCGIYNPVVALLETGVHNGLWWLDVTAASDEDIETLARSFGLHPLTVEDITQRETREKIELFDSYYFLSLRPPSSRKTDDGVCIVSHNLYAVVFPEGVLSFNFGTSLHADHVRNRIKEHRSHLALTSDWICYAIIDAIVDGFAPFIARVETGVDLMEDHIAVTRPDEIGLALQQIYKWRKEVIQIRQLLHDKTDVIRCFARHCDALAATSTQVALYLSDIRDHVLTMMANLEQAEQMLSRSQSKYLSQLHFDSGRMRNEIATALSRLTVVAATIVPMQFITGLFGMNVMVPGKSPGGLAWWYGILGVILGLIVLFLLVAKRMRLFDR